MNVRRLGKRLMLDLLLVVAGVPLILAAVLFFMQGRLLFHPTREVFATPRAVGLPFEEVTLQAADGVSLNCWYIPAPDARFTLLFCHGNGGCLAHRIESIELFHQLGLNVFIFDYRGYGKSEGKPSEQGIYLDSEAAWNYLTEKRGLKPEQIIVMGRSLGGAVAARLAAQRHPAGLVLESAFYSVSRIGSEFYPWLPVKWLVRYRLDTAAAVRVVQCPLLIIHSVDDEVVPFRHGQDLFLEAQKNTGNPFEQFQEITGTHDDGYFSSRQTYIAAWQAFLEQIISPPKKNATLPEPTPAER